METATKAPTAEWLEKVGFTRAAADVKELVSRKRKLALAYEHYRFVTPENVDKFNAELRAKTGKNMSSTLYMEYQILGFVSIQNYEKVPPESVLKNLEIAQGHKCFDSFEVAYIRNVKDPLLFGRVEKCPNRFFIDQWDDDVCIDDLLKANEG